MTQIYCLRPSKHDLLFTKVIDCTCLEYFGDKEAIKFHWYWLSRPKLRIHFRTTTSSLQVHICTRACKKKNRTKYSFESTGQQFLYRGNQSTYL